jgi:hypothetical protein
MIVGSLLGINSNARWPVSIGGQTRTFVVDGKTFTVTFAAGDTTADAVARRINAAAALVPGLTGTVASVLSTGQVHVEGRDPGEGPVRAIGGTAIALGFPGPTTAPPPPVPPVSITTPTLRVRCSDGSTAATAAACPGGGSGGPRTPPSGGGGLMVGLAVLVALGAAWKASRGKEDGM